MITNINEKGFFVILPRYGLEGFISFNEEDENKNKERESKSDLKIVHNKDLVKMYFNSN